jgi:DNA polymerase III gamma/tau subunit
VYGDLAKRRDSTADEEAQKTRLRVGEGAALEKELASYAARGFAGKVIELQKRYQTSGAGLTNPPVMDMSLVRTKEDLEERKETISDFISASEELRNFCEDAPSFYREELLNHKLSPQAREASLKQFTQSLRGINGAVVALRESDVKRGKIMLSIIELLKDNWGKWQYKPELDGVQFQNLATSRDYDRVLKHLDEAVAEEMRLQNRVKELSNAARAKPK